MAFGLLGEESVAYLPLLAVAVLSCALFLKALRGSFQTMVPLLTIFVIIYVGNYLQLFWIVTAQSEIRNYAPLWIDSMTPEVLHDAYRQATVAFALSSVVAFVLHKIGPQQIGESPSLSDHGRRVIASTGMVVAILLAVAVALLAYVYDISVVGRTAEVPFRIAGWVQNVGRTSLPALLLLVIVCADGLAGARKYFMGALVVMFLSALADVILSTSKAPVILATLRLLILFAVRGSLSRRRILWLSTMAAVGALLFPFVSDLRAQRMLGLDAEASIAMARDRGGEIYRFSVPVMLLSRVSGANMLLPILHVQARVDAETVLDGFLGGSGVTWFNTAEVHGFTLSDRTGIAPSLLGYLYIAGGESGQMIGLIAILLVLWSVWNAIAASRLLIKPVLQALFGVTMFILLAEGTVEGLAMPLAVTITSSLFLELVIHIVERNGRRAPSLSWRRDRNIL